MKERLSKIFGLLLFIVLIIVIFYLSKSGSGNGEDKIYNKILVSGNRLLEETEYLKFTGFIDSASLKNITLAEVKKKFELHPYVVKADVEYDGISEISVEVTERKFIAVLFQNQNLKLISDKYVVLPMEKRTAFYELPIISNPGQKINSSTADTLNSSEMKNAFRIIEAIKFSNEDMYDRLAEINLQLGKDIVLTFNGLHFPVMIGNGYTAKKIVCLNKIWSEINSGEDQFAETLYIDLRFKDQILIGKKETVEQNG